MKKSLPTWYIEAKEQGINYIVLVYTKAEGFAFCPDNLELPIRAGGDYDGNWGHSAKDALYYYEKYFNDAFTDKVDWFIKYVRKIHEGEDFSLADLQIEERNLRVIKGKWPW